MTTSGHRSGVGPRGAGGAAGRAPRAIGWSLALSAALHAAALAATACLVAVPARGREPAREAAKFAVARPREPMAPPFPERERVEAPRPPATPSSSSEPDPVPPPAGDEATLLLAGEPAAPGATPAPPDEMLGRLPPIRARGPLAPGRRRSPAIGLAGPEALPDSPEVAGTSSSLPASPDRAPETAPAVEGARAWARRTGGTLPRYPAAARRAGREGTARVELRVSAEGAVLSAHLLESSGHADLDEAALEAARTWTFEPLVEEGRAVEGIFRVPVVFRLKG